MIQNNTEKQELLAAVDVGSNTIRLLIGYFGDKEIIRIFKSRAVTRLGKDILKNSLLNRESIDKSVNYLIEVKNKCKSYNVSEVLAVGTSALREAINSRDFLKEVKRKTNIDIEIISGTRESELTLKGVISNFSAKRKDTLFNNCFFIVDIGGGSTEWVLSNDKIAKGSLTIGAIKSYEQFIKNDPPSSNEIESLKTFIKQQIIDSELMKSLTTDFYSKRLDFIVTGGTAVTIAAIDMGLVQYDGDKINLHQISYPTLQLLIEKLTEIPLIQRQMIKGLEPDRADIIITGSIILLCLMEIIKINELIVSDFGLLEGLIYERGILKKYNAS